MKFKNPLAKAGKLREAKAENKELQADKLRLELKSAEALDTVDSQAEKISHLEQEVAEAPYKAREELVGQYGIRIGYRDFDLQKLQARVRAVEPSLRIESEEFRWVFYAGRQLEEPQIRRLESMLGFTLERG